MKILFITSGSVHSSLSYREVAFGKYLVTSKNSVYLLAPLFDKHSFFKDEQIKEVNGIKVMRPLQPHFLPFDIGLLFYIFSALWHILFLQPDIIHIYKSTPLTIIGLPMKWFFNKKIVFDTDDLDSEVMKLEKHSFIRTFLVTLSEKLLSNFADVIISGSLYLQQYYQKKFPKKLVVHIPNGAEFSKTSFQIKKHQEERIIFIGNINRLSILKPIFLALEVLKKRKTLVKTIIIGDGKYLSHFKQLAKALALSRVSFLGHIQRRELNKYVLAGDIGYSYMPNEITQKACSNMKVFQYMQYGAVPLVSDIGDLPLYVYNSKAGYIAKHSSIDSLVSTIEIALQNKKERLDKIRFALSHARKDYKWSILVKKVEIVYQKIMI